MTRDQLGACIELDKLGFKSITMPVGVHTLTPGLILFADEGHRKLLLLQGDGTVVDLLAVHAAAEDTVRNWGEGSKLPHFVGDFGRLTKLAMALNGYKPEEIKL